MDVFECIKTRHSVRDYQDKEVEFDKITEIVDSARFAPAAGNIYNRRFIVIRNEDQINMISDACSSPWMRTAPVLIVVVAEPTKLKHMYGSRGEFLYTIQNSASAVTHILLSAHALGVGSCWVGSFDENALRDALGLPEDVFIQAIVTLGYPKHKTHELHPKSYIKKDVNIGGGYLAGKEVPDSSHAWYSVRWPMIWKGLQKLFKREVKKVKEKIEEAAQFDDDETEKGNSKGKKLEL